VDSRVRFAGRVDEDELAGLYARCRATFYAPIDEDFGMGPYESFLSGKPVVTTTDAGGPLDVVRDSSTGFVVAPQADAVAGVLRRVQEHPEEAARLGSAGRVIAVEVTWDRALERLLS
jgi:glycosyltransferase involved in cell wall biosynthesis